MPTAFSPFYLFPRTRLEYESDSVAITPHYYKRRGWFKLKCAGVNKQKREGVERRRGCPWTPLAFAPLETSEVISGTIIRAIDEGGTVINVTPSLRVPGRGHRDHYCPLSIHCSHWLITGFMDKPITVLLLYGGRFTLSFLLRDVFIPLFMLLSIF